jgi:hypothetical protein
VGAPLDVLNPLFYVEILVAGPCETFKPRVDTLYSRLNNLYKAAKLLALVPKVGPFFDKVAKFFKKPVEALEEVQEAMKDGCKKVSKTRQYARKTLEIMNHVGTAAGIFGSLTDYFLISICNQANSNADDARVRNVDFSTPRLRRGLATSGVDAELRRQATVIKTRTAVPKAIFDFAQDFEKNVAPVLNDLKNTWDRVETELEGIFAGIEDVVEIFAPFEEIFEVAAQLDCSQVPVLSLVCEALDFLNVLIEELLDFLGIGELLDELFDDVRNAIGLPDDFLSFDMPFDGLIDIDLDGLLPNFDDLLLQLRKDLMAELPNPIDDIHREVEKAVNILNEAQSPEKYEIMTSLTHTNKAAWSCPLGFMPVVSSATYYGPNCVDKLDGVWRIPCPGKSRECTLDYLNPDSRLTCSTDESLDTYTSAQPKPSLSLPPPLHTFTSVYLCVPPDEIENLGIMPILNLRDGSTNFPVVRSTIEQSYSNKEVCEKQLGGSFIGTRPVINVSFDQLGIQIGSLVTTDHLFCAGDARAVYLEYRSQEPTSEALACLDVNGPLYGSTFKDGYGMTFLCLDVLSKAANLGPDGGIYPNDQGPAYCMSYPDTRFSQSLVCNAQGIVPFGTNPQCNLPDTAAEGAVGKETVALNVNRMRVWSHLQTTKKLYTKDAATCLAEYRENCKGKISCTKPEYCPALQAQFACIFTEDALDGAVQFTFGDSLVGRTSSGYKYRFECKNNQEVVIESAARGRGLGGAYGDVTADYVERLVCPQDQKDSCEIIIRFEELGEQTLRLEFGCECVVGFVKEPDEFGDCIACAPGTKRAAADAVCRKCLEGTYQGSNAADRCLPCPVGTYAIGSGSDRCTACPAGTSSSTIGATSENTCQPCSPGNWAGPAAGICIPCNEGESTNGLGGAPKCDECVRGTVAAGTGNSECAACPLGTYVKEGRAASCTVCPTGTYAADLGSTFCTPCPPGSFAASAKSTECTCCPEGEFIYEQFLRATSDLCQEIIIDPAIADIDPFSETDDCLASLVEIGNGLCSPYANTKACNWDGGDCCYETCIYNQTTSGASCYFNTLQCLDPDPESDAVDIMLRRPSDFEPVTGEAVAIQLPKQGCA